MSGAPAASGTFRLLYFSAPWCQPCRALGPAVARLDVPGLTVEKHDVSQEQAEAARWQVQSVPTLLLVDANDFPVAQADASVGASRLEGWVRAAMGRAK